MSFALSLVCIRSMNRGNKGYRRFSAIQLNKGGKFLKKLWCCIDGGGGGGGGGGGRYYKEVWFYQLS